MLQETVVCPKTLRRIELADPVPFADELGVGSGGSSGKRRSSWCRRSNRSRSTSRLGLKVTGSEVALDFWSLGTDAVGAGTVTVGTAGTPVAAAAAKE